MMFNKFIIILFMILLFLVPESIHIFGLSYPKILLIFVFILIIYNLIIKKEKVQFEKNFLTYLILGLLVFAFWIFLVNLIITIITKQFILSNFFEVLRPILYAGILFLTRIYSKNDKNYIKKIFLIFIVLNCLVGISQRYNPFNINELYVKIIAPTQYQTLLNNYPDPRVVGLTGNPNIFGFLLALALLVTFYEIFVNNKKKYYLLLLLEAITLFMTMSRTSFICSIVMVFSFLFIYLFKTHNLKKFFKTFFITSFFILTLTFTLPNSITWRIKQLINIDNLTSWIARVENNKESIDNIFGDDKLDDNENNNNKDENNNKPEDTIQTDKISHNVRLLIGVGSDKLKQYGLVYDNEYLMIIFKYGIIGFCLFLLIFILPLFRVNKLKNEISSLYCSMFIGALIYMLPAAIYHSYKLFPIFCFIIAVYFEQIKYNKDKKTVLMIATYFPPAGGVGVFRITKFVKYLKKMKYNPIVVTMDEKFITNKDNSFLNDIKDCKVYRLNFDAKTKIAKQFYYALKQEINEIIIKEKPSVVFITGGPFYVLPIGRFLYDKYDLPYIIDLRDPWAFQKNKNNFKSKLIKLKNILLERYTFKKASCILTVNETMENMYKNFYPKYNFLTITNGYDEEDFLNIKPKQFNDFTIVYTGKFDVSAGFRDPSDLFKVIKELNNEQIFINFVHVGEVEQKVVDLAKKYDVIENCQFVGFKSYKESLQYCKGANIQIILTGNESSEMTTKVFDYMGCEKPIIAITNKNNELYKICNDNKGIFVVEHNDIEKLKNTIKYIIENKYISKSDFNMFSREKLTKKLIKIIEKINKE